MMLPIRPVALPSRAYSLNQAVAIYLSFICLSVCLSVYNHSCAIDPTTTKSLPPSLSSTFSSTCVCLSLLAPALVLVYFTCLGTGAYDEPPSARLCCNTRPSTSLQAL